MEALKTLTVDGVSYEVETLSEPVKRAIAVYNLLQADLQKAQLEVLKCQAAANQYSTEIANAVKNEAQKTEPDTTEEPASSEPV